MTIGALSSEFWIQITDLKQLSGIQKTNMVLYIIASKVNSTFRMTGNATADEMTAKVVGKNSELSL